MHEPNDTPTGLSPLDVAELHNWRLAKEQRMKERSRAQVVLTTLGIYITIGLMCFGHAASRTKIVENKYSSEGEQRVSAGLGAALFWPAYLSWVIFEKSDKVEP